MIEVVAKLLRGPVFLTGEVLECVITFTNPMTARSTSASSEMLAWASAQIHCQFHTSESRVALPPSEDAKHDVQAENETVFVPNRGERGKCILATPPKILFCDLRLDPGESKSYSYCEHVPLDGPPSFRGQSVKYVYKLTVGCQRVNSPIKLLRVPFRVFVVYGLDDYQFPPDEAVAPTNPFLDEDENIKKDTRLVDLATEMLMSSTSRRSLLSLQTEEHVQEEYQRKPRQPLSLSTHARHQESCLHTAKTHFSLPIPLSATPSFITSVVSLRWRLHFEFVTAREPVEPPTVLENQSEIITWTGAGKIDVDTFSWDLPMKLRKSTLKNFQLLN
ncbi:hypothetical protein scyTo_0010616 [Scyliorhinus torazame]|uniref:Arrestin C-terminal-like domain-containing protein n=1 Tax=Scyliorhinus torazame TaxID=75743 RepID=A0A401P9B9_SCYTO|nr:hypothetical protein [Scyliorhinus torazame]